MKRSGFIAVYLIFLCSLASLAQQAEPSQVQGAAQSPAKTPTAKDLQTSDGPPIIVRGAAQSRFDPLPVAVSNNAVAQVKAGKHSYIFSFMGIGAKKTWDAVTNTSYALDEDTGKWSPINPVPGPAGRIAASAIGAHGEAFLFGGYTVDSQGGEITVPDVAIYEPISTRWYRGPDMPVRVDDSVAGVFHDRYIYLISGWSNT